MSSDIRIFVRWKEQCVFAGEDVECTITFKNVANPHENLSPSTPIWPSRRRSSHNTLHSMPPMPEYRRSPSTNAPSKSQPLAHGRDRQRRGTEPLNLPATPVLSPKSPLYSPGNGSIAQAARPHQRSISIVSMGSGDVGKSMNQAPHTMPPPRPGYRHNRSASLQYLPRRSEGVQTTRNSGESPSAQQAVVLTLPSFLWRLQAPGRPNSTGS